MLPLLETRFLVHQLLLRIIPCLVMCYRPVLDAEWPPQQRKRCIDIRAFFVNTSRRRRRVAASEWGAMSEQQAPHGHFGIKNALPKSL